MDAINHPGMSKEFFDKAVGRAMMAEVAIQKTSRASVVSVGSTTDADVSYLVSRTQCGCKGHEQYGRCLHRAIAIAFWDVFSKVELGSATADDSVA